MNPQGPPDYIVLEWENGDRIRISDNDIEQIIANINAIGPMIGADPLTKDQINHFTAAAAGYAIANAAFARLDR